MKRVVVLGSEGFVGRTLVKRLVVNQVNVVRIDDSPNGDNLKDGEFLKANILELSENDLFSLFHDSTVVYLAAVSTSDACESNPFTAIQVNLEMTMKIIQIATKANSHLIFASSEWVYEDFEPHRPCFENDQLKLSPTTNFYSMTKIIGEWMFQRYAASYTILRFGIIYGERKKPQSALESIVHSALTKNSIEIGNLQTSRRFIHVEDLCDAIVKVIKCGYSEKEIYNLSGTELIPLAKAIEILEEILLFRINTRTLGKPVSVRDPNSLKFISKYDWKPQISTHNGLERLVKFYQKTT